MSKLSFSVTLSLASVLALAAACGDDESPNNNGNGGSAGSAGRGGSAGSSGSGQGGSGGDGGSAGADNGGSAGESGAAGSAGAAGTAGSAGSAGAAGSSTADAGADAGGNVLGFFVSTPSDSGGDLGGIDGADALCETLADEVGAGDRTWRAYLSTDDEDARDRIGEGPWANANGTIIANNLDELHNLTGDVDLFVDHEGNRINGQWAGSPTPNEHDIMTGSDENGEALEDNCNNWTSDDAEPGPNVGHSDGLGPGMNAAAPFNSWNASHAPDSCSQDDLEAVGGAGRIYCFAAD